MGTLGLVLSSIGGYFGVAMTAYRVHYIRLFKRYRRWQGEKPEITCTWFSRSDHQRYEIKRKDMTFDNWVGHFMGEWDTPPGLMFLWPLVFLILGSVKFLRPTVKIADPGKLDALEKDVRKELGA